MMTIRTRLTLWYSSLLATVIVVFAISLFTILDWAWHSQLEENMRVVAQQIEDRATIDPLTGFLTLNTVSMLNMPPYYYPYGIMVRDSLGRMIGGSTNFSPQDPPLDPDSLDTTTEVTRQTYLSNHHVLAMTYPVHKEGIVCGTIQVVSNLAVIDATQERLLRVMLSVGAVALLFSFVVGSIIAKQALQPIDGIAQAARQITAADDLSKRIPYNGPPDELGQLTTTFNATLERLERLFIAQRRFVADVSHELRTPLTTIQGNLDIFKRYNDPDSLEAVDSEVKRMSRLVGDLLLLAQADAGRLPLKPTNVELATLALEVYRNAQVLAKDIDLRLGVINAVNVYGDSDRLKQLLLNLVTNAIKYTPAGGKVVINVDQHDGYAYMSVTDTGIGIPKEDLEHIFDRFYRVDRHRSRAMGGTGLGLSIAQWIVEAHNGRIIAESELGKGSTFTVQLVSLDTVLKPESVRDTRPRLIIPSVLRRQRTPSETKVPSKPDNSEDTEDNKSVLEEHRK